MSNESSQKPKGLSRDLLLFILITAMSTALFALWDHSSSDAVSMWFLDNDKCSSCGACATECVKPLSAVQAIIDTNTCSKRYDCPAYFNRGAKPIEFRENIKCPTGALTRIPYNGTEFLYTIDSTSCIGCGKCVKLCQKKCEGALTLVIDTEECVDCNKCAIAVTCPEDAISNYEEKVE